MTALTMCRVEETVEQIEACGKMLALIIRASHAANGIQFFTPPEFSQQLAYMNRPAGHVIAPHVHVESCREVRMTKEVLFVKSGRLRMDLYDESRRYVKSRELRTGDVVLLAYGGHGFQMMEPTELIEVKQGPYGGDRDKVRFEPLPFEQVCWD